MAQTIKFDASGNKDNPHCLACEGMLADVLDDILTPVDQAWFDLHVAGCADCEQMLADAKRGHAWLELLKTPRPEPSAALLDRIFASTEWDTESGAAPLGSEAWNEVPTIPRMMNNTKILAFRPRLPRLAAMANSFFEPRLAMTAAMAFFSIALTLNLTGVKLNQLSASDLNPNNLKRTYYQAAARTVRYYDNLRVVRVLESRVDDFRQSNDAEQPLGHPERTRPAPAPEPAPERTVPEQKQKPEGPQGMSLRETPLARPDSLNNDAKLWQTRSVSLTPGKPVLKEGGLA